MQIIDSHIHFWEPSTLRYGWLADAPTINKPYLPADLPARGDGWQMDALVFVEADCAPEQCVQEANWVTQLAQQDPRIQAMVAATRLEQPNAQATLEQLQAYPIVTGIRRLIQSEPLGFCVQPAFIAGVQLLPRYGYTFDICIKHHQLPDAIELVRQLPNVQFVLDHIGKPNIKDGFMDDWRKHISALARFENVSCKLSGMVTEADLDHWQPAQLSPYIEHTLEAFGVQRVMFGGDYPVLELAHIRYSDWVALVLLALQSLSAAEQHAVLYQNAAKFYRLT